MTTTVPAVPIEPTLEAAMRAVAEAHRASEAERDRLVARAAAAGGSLREIAEAVGLSHSGVKRIVERTKLGCEEGL